MTSIRVSAAALLAGAALFGQPAAKRPQFEVASVKPSPAQMPNQAAIGVHIDGAQLRCSFLALREYLAMAYRMKPYQITGPDWIATEKFDISAKMPDGIERDQVPEMIQALLEERFQLKSHRDKKEFPVYGVVVAKGGLKIQPLPPDPENPEGARRTVSAAASGGIRGVNVNLGYGSSFTLANNKIEAKKLTLTEFSDIMARFADRPVVDMTNTPGRFDFSVDLTPEDYRSLLIRSAINAGVALPPEAMRLLEGVSEDSLFLALQSVGLKMETRRSPLDVLVIDSISRNPTEN